MKNPLYYFLLLFAASLLPYSCTEKNDLQNSFKIEQASEIIETFNSNKTTQHKGEHLQGRVFMRSAEKNMMVVFLNNESLGSDTQVFQFQSNGTINQSFKSTMAEAELLFLGHSLVINSLNSKERYWLKLSDAASIPALNHTGEVIEGFGLAKYRLENSDLATASTRTDTFGNPGDPPPAEGCFCTNDSDIPCDSGGEGSYECGGGYGAGSAYCSVTCSLPSWSCCTVD